MPRATTRKSVSLMVGSIIIFGLIILLGLTMPIFNHSRDWGFKPAAVMGVLLLVAVVVKMMGWI